MLAQAADYVAQPESARSPSLYCTVVVRGNLALDHWDHDGPADFDLDNRRDGLSVEPTRPVVISAPQEVHGPGGLLPILDLADSCICSIILIVSCQLATRVAARHKTALSTLGRAALI
jgi:hypothetical protein